MTRRILTGCLVLAVTLLPMVASWLLMIGMASSPEPKSTPVATPNPPPAPAPALGPVEVVVYAEPSFAGIMVFWLVAWLPVLATYSILAACAPARRRGPTRLATAAFLLGTAFAAPWIYGLYHIFTEG